MKKEKRASMGEEEKQLKCLLDPSKLDVDWFNPD